MKINKLLSFECLDINLTYVLYRIYLLNLTQRFRSRLNRGSGHSNLNVMIGEIGIDTVSRPDKKND